MKRIFLAIFAPLAALAMYCKEILTNMTAGLSPTATDLLGLPGGGGAARTLASYPDGWAPSRMVMAGLALAIIGVMALPQGAQATGVCVGNSIALTDVSMLLPETA